MSQLDSAFARYRKARQMAEDLGLPPPAPPRRRRRETRMPEVPAAARGARERARAQRGRGLEGVAESLWGKLLTGTQRPGPGIVPFASLPESARKQLPVTAPPIGWDVHQLDPRERALLRRLVQIGAPVQTEITPQERAKLERMSMSQQRAEAVRQRRG